MNSNQFTPEQQEKIQRVGEFSNQTKERVIKVLQENNWREDIAIDFLINAGPYISDPNPPNLQQQPNINSKISQQNNNQNPIPSTQKLNNNPQQFKKSSKQNEVEKLNSQKKIDKNDIQKIEEQLKLIYNQEWETTEIVQAKQQMLQKSLIKNIIDAEKRIYHLPVGLDNVGKKGYFNCIIQILVQNPDFLQRVLTCKADLKLNNQENKIISFIEEFQMILRMLTFTNQRFLNHNKFVQITSDLIDTLTKTQISKKNLQPNEFLEIFIIILDVVLCNKEYKKEQSKILQDLTLKTQFQIIQQSIPEISLNFIREDRFLYLSLLKLVCQDQFIKFAILPQTFSFSLRSNKNNNNSKVDYWLPFRINLEFLINEKVFKEPSNSLLNEVNDNKIEEINSKQKLLNSLIIVEQSYEQNKIIPINVIDQLRIERKNVQNEIQKCFLQNQSLIATEVYQNQLYYLHAAVIEISNGDQQHYYVYIYNFVQNQWYRYNDRDVRMESDEIVKKDIFQNGCFIVYVIQNQMNKIKDYQEKQIKISRNLDLEYGIINWNELEQGQLIKPLIPKEIKQIIQSQNQNQSFRNQDQ